MALLKLLSCHNFFRLGWVECKSWQSSSKPEMRGCEQSSNALSVCTADQIGHGKELSVGKPETGRRIDASFCTPDPFLSRHFGWAYFVFGVVMWCDALDFCACHVWFHIGSGPVTVFGSFESLTDMKELCHERHERHKLCATLFAPRAIF